MRISKFGTGREFIKPTLALLLSFLAAVSMWYAVSVRDQLEAQLEVQVDYHGIPAGLVVTEGLISKLTVRLRGPETLVRSIPQQRLKESIDLSSIKKGITVVPFIGERLGPALRAFDVVDIQPTRIVIEADTLVERSVPLEVEVKSPLRGGALKVEDVKVKPASVILRGPETVLDKIESLPVEILLDPKSTGSIVKTTTTLDTPSLVSATPSQVRVEYMITSGRTVVSRRCRLLWAGSGQEDLRMEPDKIHVLVEVPEALAGNADYLSKLEARVMPPSLQVGQSTVATIKYSLPDGMILLNPAPKTVKVTRRLGQ